MSVLAVRVIQEVSCVQLCAVRICADRQLDACLIAYDPACLAETFTGNVKMMIVAAGLNELL